MHTQIALRARSLSIKYIGYLVFLYDYYVFLNKQTLMKQMQKASYAIFFEPKRDKRVPEPRKTLATMKALANAQGIREFEERLKALQSSAAWSSVGRLGFLANK